MMTTIFLVRHGQTDSNVNGFYMSRSDEDLNEVGYTQVRRLSLKLASLPITSVYTSPLKRTYTTAAIIAEPHQLEAKVSDDLTEILLGDWQGLHLNKIKLMWPELWQQWRTDPSGVTLPNGESLKEVTERAIRTTRKIAEANKGKQTVIVTHDVIIRVLVAYVLGVPNSIYRRFEISNASLSEIRFTDHGPMLIVLNDKSHLIS